MERIKSFYEKEGFIDAAASFKYDQYSEGNVNLVILISQGKQYFVDKVTMVGNAVVPEHEILEKMLEIKPGKVFSREKLNVDIANIRTLYFDKGYIFANVRESTSLNSQTGKVEIKLDVQEGNLAYVNRIRIQGNDRTRDIVIRRELRLYPGDRFDGEKLRRSKQRLRNLGYFEDINYDIQDTDKPDQKDLVVQVKETKTGTFSFGGGYSTVDQVVGFIEVEQKNFDFTNWPNFTGGGQNLQIRAETGSTRNNTRLSFTEPWIFDHPISGGFDAYIMERDREKDVGFAYDEKRVGGDIRFGKQFTEFVSGNVDYRIEDITIGNFEEGVSADLLSEEGKNTVSSVGLNLSRD
jgi:outer membrane protein insertion porin family